MQFKKRGLWTTQKKMVDSSPFGGKGYSKIRATLSTFVELLQFEPDTYTSAKIICAAATGGVIKFFCFVLFFFNPVIGRMNGYCQKNPLYPVLKISMSHFSFCKTQIPQTFPLPFWSSEQAFKGETKKFKF